EAMHHQDYPLALLVEGMNLERDPSRAPLIQVAFTLETSHRLAEMGAWRFAPPEAHLHMEVGGLQTEPYPVAQRASQLDLEVVLEEGAQTIDGILRYNADLFDPETMSRLVRHFQTLLEGAVADPDGRLTELPWLTEAERRQVLHECNQTRADYPRG